MICVSVFGIFKCYILAAAVIIVLILCFLMISKSVAELKSPMRIAPRFSQEGIIIEQL